MNACNLTSVLAPEKNTVWLPTISIINPLRSFFIISSSIRTAQQRSFWTTVTQSQGGWIQGIPSLIVISCLQIVGEEWLWLNYIWFCTQRGAKRSLSSYAALKGYLGWLKLRRERHNKPREKKGCFSICFKSMGRCGVKDANRFSIEFWREKQIQIQPFKNTSPGANPGRKLHCWEHLYNKRPTAACRPILYFY